MSLNWASGLVKSQCETNYKGVACYAPLTEKIVINGVPVLYDQGKCDAKCASTLGANWKWSDSFNKAGLYKSINCVRKSYDAQLSSCCLNKPSGYGQACDPSYRTNASPCLSTLRSYCGDGDKILSDPMCKQWAIANPSYGADLKLAFCGRSENLGRADCRAICIASGGRCDPGAIEYCKTAGADADFCACLKSTTPRAECLDVKCSNVGYKTSAMQTGTGCPSIVNCVSNLIASGNANDVERTNITQYCGAGNDPANYPRPATGNTASGTNASTGTNTSTGSTGTTAPGVDYVPPPNVTPTSQTPATTNTPSTDTGNNSGAANSSPPASSSTGPAGNSSTDSSANNSSADSSANPGGAGNTTPDAGSAGAVGSDASQTKSLFDTINDAVKSLSTATPTTVTPAVAPATKSSTSAPVDGGLQGDGGDETVDSSSNMTYIIGGIIFAVLLVVVVVVASKKKSAPSGATVGYPAGYPAYAQQGYPGYTQQGYR